MARLPQPGKVIIHIDPAYFRPTEVETLLGDPRKAREKLGWQPEITFNELVRRWSQTISWKPPANTSASATAFPCRPVVKNTCE